MKAWLKSLLPCFACVTEKASEKQEADCKDALQLYRAIMFCSEKSCDCDSPEGCKKIKRKKNKTYCRKKACRKKAKAALIRAHDIRKFEIELLWKRTTYMSTFQAFLFAALGVSFSADSPELSIYVLRIIVCIVGVFSALFWFLMNKGSKFWYGNWEIHIDFLEYEFEGNLHKTVFSGNEEKPFSVSRINMSTSFMFFGTWCVLAVLILSDFIQRLCLWQCFWAQYSHIFYPALIAILLVICLCCCRGLHSRFRGVDKGKMKTDNENTGGCASATSAGAANGKNEASANNGDAPASPSSVDSQGKKYNVFLVKQKWPDNIECSPLTKVSIWKEIFRFLFCRECNHDKCCKCCKSNCR